MLPTAMVILVLTAFICTICAAMGKCPEWVGQIIICIILLLQYLPK